MDPLRPFQFLDLPDEIRLGIYEIAFGDVPLVVDVLSGNGERFYHPARCLPQILCASKRIRSEALPLFVRNMEPVFCNIVGHKICSIPRYCLQHFRRITVVDAGTEVPPVQLMPRLTELVLQDRRRFESHTILTPEASNMEEAVPKVIKQMESFCLRVGNMTDIKPRFKLLLDVTIRLEPDQNPVDVKIDWETRKIISQKLSSRIVG